MAIPSGGHPPHHRRMMRHEQGLAKCGRSPIRPRPIVCTFRNGRRIAWTGPPIVRAQIGQNIDIPKHQQGLVSISNRGLHLFIYQVSPKNGDKTARWVMQGNHPLNSSQKNPGRSREPYPRCLPNCHTLPFNPPNPSTLHRRKRENARAYRRDKTLSIKCLGSPHWTRDRRQPHPNQQAQVPRKKMTIPNPGSHPTL